MGRDPDDAVATTHLARLLAACPDDKLRDGARAKALAEKARALTRESEPFALAAMAAADAELGRFPSAAAWQEMALGLSRDPEAKARARARLALYRKGQPLRDPTP